jgi:drug/metabolite transporter (DMT)-like permease
MSSSSLSVAPQQNMSLLNWSLLILLSILWGGAFFFTGVAVKELPVLTIVFARVSIAALTLFVFMKISGVKFPTAPNILIAFLVMGLINNVIPFFLIVSGQTVVGSGLASVLNGTTPLFTALVAHFATSDTAERMGPRRVVGILSGIVGVGILLAPKIEEVGFSGSEVLGQLAILAAALSYGVAAVYGRRFAKAGIPSMAAAAGQVSGSSLIILPFALFIDQPWTFIADVSPMVLGSVVCLAVFSTGVAYILYFQLINTAGATNASLVTLLIPASAIVLGVLFLNEMLTIYVIGGMASIGMGLLVIDGRVLAYFHKKSPV